MFKFKLTIVILFTLNTFALSVEAIKRSRELKILTRNAPTTFYLDKDGNPAGMDYELGNLLAKELGVLPKFIVKDSINDILISLRGGEGDVAIAGLSRTKDREKDFLFSRHYQSIKQQLVCHPRFIIKTLKRLSKVKILTAEGSSYVERLEELKKKYPKIKYNTTTEMNTEEILGEISDKNVDCTLADSNIVSVFLRIYPELKIQRSFAYEGLSMMMPKEHKELKKLSDNMIERILKNGVLTKIEDRYYGHIREFDYYDYKVFKKRMKSRLKKYKRYFLKAAKKYEIDWRLLAAISYQESHWNPKAKSPTGVRGMMMLTNNTARQMKVANRLDPYQSIMGGARYIKRLMSRIPLYIQNPDRRWMAIASYNVGYYHLRDARSIAVWKEKNPNIWKDVKEVLPLLANKRYFKRLPYGYARGREPVLYVKRIRHYYDILKKEYP